MEKTDPTASMDSPYESHYRVVRWIGGMHNTHPLLGPGIFTAASLYLFRGPDHRRLGVHT
jgi:hypothetical protein